MADRNSGTDDVTPIMVMQWTSCCWPTNGMRYVLAELGSVQSVPESVQPEPATRPSEEKRPGQVLSGSEFTDKTLLGQNFILGAKDDVGALSPIFSISSERVNRLRLFHLTEESLVQFI